MSASITHSHLVARLCARAGDTVLRVGVTLLLVVPFLNPIHLAPIATFVEESLAIAIGMAIIAGALVLVPRSLKRMPMVAAYLLAFACFVQLQPLLVEAPYRQPALLYAGYVAWAALLAWAVSAARESMGTQRVVELCILAIVVASAANAAIGFVQIYFEGLSPRWLVFPAQSGRASGNVAQPNLYASLLLIGVASTVLWCARSTARLGAGAALLAIQLWGLALSGSRMATVGLGVLAGLVTFVWWRDRSEISQRTLRLAWGVAAAGIALQILLPTLHQVLGVTVTSVTPLQRLEGGSSNAQRLFIWQQAWNLFYGSPVLGVGVGNFSWEFFRATPDIASVGVRATETHSHNLLLQLLVDTGILGTVIVGAGLAGWGLRFLRSRAELGYFEWVWVAAVVLILGLHSMLEYPLWFAHFLGIAAIVLGLGESKYIRLDTARLLRPAIFALWCAGCVLAVSSVDSYSRIHNWIYPDRLSITPASQQALFETYPDVADLSASTFATYLDLGLVAGLPLSEDLLESRRELVRRSMKFAPVRQTVVLLPILDALGTDEVSAAVNLRLALAMYPDSYRELNGVFVSLAQHDEERFDRYVMLLERVRQDVELSRGRR